VRIVNRWRSSRSSLDSSGVHYYRLDWPPPTSWWQEI